MKTVRCRGDGLAVRGLLLLAAVLLTLSEAQLSDPPQQVHIAYGEAPTSMNIAWQTFNMSNSIVHYGTNASALSLSATGSQYVFTVGNPNGTQVSHRVTLTDLNPGTVYYYQCESNGLLSSIFSFQAMPDGTDWVPRFLVYGDMGRFDGSPTLKWLIKETQAGSATAAIHVGDFAYDLDTFGGQNGDKFMEQIEPIASAIPYMTCPGNHELNFNMSHYMGRFFMPNFENSYNMWYSWNIHQVHFISYSTEVYFSTWPSDQEQRKWIEMDLIEANLPENRAARPWIIAYGHRPMYCSNTDDDDCTTARSTVRAELEDLFYQYGVDVVIEAHEHSYERLWPVYNEVVTQHNYSNPMAPVHIVSGAAGCNENEGLCLNRIKKDPGPWSAFSSWFLTYGYAHLEVHNATHLYWKQLWDLDDVKLDDIWITQDKHGPFADNYPLNF